MSWAMPPAGYDPAMVGVVRRLVLEAIASLDTLRCHDPLAAPALAVVRLARANLETHWLGLLDDIERSRAMIEWKRAASDPLLISTSALARWIDDRTLGGPTRYTDLTDRELIALVERTPLAVDDRGQFDPAAVTIDPELIRELGLRSEADPAFLTVLTELAARHPAAFLDPTSLPTSAVAQLSHHLLRDVPWTDEAATDATAATGAAMLDELARRDPDALLALLDDDGILTTLATWPFLDGDAVRNVVGSTLHDHVVAADRLPAGYVVLGRLARMAPTTLDEGMTAAFAQGLAAALPVYLPTLAPAIRSEGVEPVRVAPGGRPPTTLLSSYEELRELFGAILRDDDAQLIVGTALGAYTKEVAMQLGPRLADSPGAEHVAQVADLVRDAADAEIAEARTAAAATLAHRRRVGSLVGSAATVLATAMGIGTALRTTAKQTINLAASSSGTADGVTERLRRVSIAAQTYDNLTVAAVVEALDAHRSQLTPIEHERLRARLQQVEAAGDDVDRRRTAVIELDLVAGGVPPVQRFVDAVRSRSGVDELREHRRPDEP